MQRPTLFTLTILAFALPGCAGDDLSGSPSDSPPGDGDTGDGGGDDSGDGDEGGGGEEGGGDEGGGEGGGGDGEGDGDAGDPESVSVALAPRVAGAERERVNFALPLEAGTAADPGRIRVLAGGDEIPAHVEPIAWHRDDSIRSAQIQADIDVSATAELEIQIGAEATAGSIDSVPVADTLIDPDGTSGPRVLAILPPSYLTGTGVVGPTPASEPEGGATLGAFSGVCDYDRYDTDRFLADSGSRGAWLYDRPTAMFRLHALTGAEAPLLSALREAHIYREGLTGSGTDTRIGVPTAQNDLKYHYAQGMAIAYLLTGDDRLRARAEDVADRASTLWTPNYVPGGSFWTERHAGFALLTYVWAARVSHDRRDDFLALADDAVAAYLEQQANRPPGYDDPDARCFAYDSGRSREGCSPWLSAILADGLEEYAAERGGEAAERAREGLVKLGRFFARYGRDSTGKPYDWVAGDGSFGETDPHEEHWGESAYLAAMAWHHDGRRDSDLKAVAEELLAGLESRGVAPHTRSFNWQCRGAPLAPLYLDNT